MLIDLSNYPTMAFWKDAKMSEMEEHLRDAMLKAIANLTAALHVEKSREVPVQKKEYGLLGVPKLQEPYWYTEYVAQEALHKYLDKEYAASSCVMPLSSNIISGKPYPSKWSEKASKPSVEARRPYLPDHLL